MRRFIRHIVSVASFLALAYVFFLVPLGELTLFQRARNFVQSDNAKAIGKKAGKVATDVGEHLEKKIDEHVIDDADGKKLDDLVQDKIDEGRAAAREKAGEVAKDVAEVAAEELNKQFKPLVENINER